MAHFAKIENEIVTNVIVVDNQFEEQGQIWINEVLRLEGEWIQTSYNGNFRKNYAGIGYYYDSVRDAFIPPKPFPSWTLNEESCLWDSPVLYPSDGKMYTWNEEILNWQEINLTQ